eukprot:Skav204592  [mRNA]  locus=scaffold672:162158:163746:- [translate_table: standard]
MEDHEYNHGWRWAIAFALGTVFFAAHYAGQKLGVIPGPHVDGEDKELDSCAPSRCRASQDAPTSPRAGQHVVRQGRALERCAR